MRCIISTCDNIPAEGESGLCAQHTKDLEPNICPRCGEDYPQRGKWVWGVHVCGVLPLAQHRRWWDSVFGYEGNGVWRSYRRGGVWRY